MNRHFSEEDIQVANRHMKKSQHHSSSGKYKSKPPWDTPSHRSEWLKLTQTTDVHEDAEKGEHFCTVGGNANWCSHSGKQYGGSSKIKNRTTLWTSNCSIRNLSKGYKNTYMKGHMHPNVYSSIINSSQIMERAQMSIDWWMGNLVFSLNIMFWQSTQVDIYEIC